MEIIDLRGTTWLTWTDVGERLKVLRQDEFIQILHDSSLTEGLGTFLANEGCRVLESAASQEGWKSIVVKTGAKRTENCPVCGHPLAYLAEAVALVCSYCQKEEPAYIRCPQDHYVCEECHGKDTAQFIIDSALATRLKDPLEIAEKMMAHPALPMLGCEYASIAAGALGAALRNSVDLALSDAQLLSAIDRTRKQSLSGYCGLTGVCGIPIAIGAVFSVILGGRCGEDKPTAITMRVVGRMVDAVANAMGPSCCQLFVRTGLSAAGRLAKDYLGIDLPLKQNGIVCTASHRHPHGCLKRRCPYYGTEVGS